MNYLRCKEKFWFSYESGHVVLNSKRLEEDTKKENQNGYCIEFQQGDKIIATFIQTTVMTHETDDMWTPYTKQKVSWSKISPLLAQSFSKSCVQIRSLTRRFDPFTRLGGRSKTIFC